MTAWLQMWSYRVQNRLTPNRPEWAHLLLCSHCHGINRWCRQQERKWRTAR